MTDQTTAPAGVVSSNQLGLLREWADASGTRFVCRSHGLQTTNTVSHDDLLQLVQAAVVAERERCAQVCDLHSRLTWNDERKAQSRVLAGEIRRWPNTMTTLNVDELVGPRCTCLTGQLGPHYCEVHSP
jgi:hypothetical protein